MHDFWSNSWMWMLSSTLVTKYYSSSLPLTIVTLLKWNLHDTASFTAHFPFRALWWILKSYVATCWDEMSVSATKETLTSLGNQHVCCGAGSCKIQMFFPLFVNGEQEKQWKSKQRGQLGATQFNVHMSCQVSQFKFLYESIILDSAMVFQNLSGLNLSPFFKVPWIF